VQKTILAAILSATIAGSGTCTAGTLEDELEAIKARLNAVEQQLKDQIRANEEKERRLAEQDREIADLRQSEVSSSGGGWFQSVELGGVVEIAAGYTDPATGDSASDIVVATAEIGIGAKINNWVTGEITLLYEEDDTDLKVDVAMISIADPKGPWIVSAGQQYVPFGTYETNLVSDPLTLEIGETRETAVLAGMDRNGLRGGVYIFNGDLEKDGDIAIGAFAGYRGDYEDAALTLNMGYISDIGNSDNLQQTIKENIDANSTDYEGEVPGATVDLTLTVGPFVLITEYTTATDSFHSNELEFNGKGAKPSALNVEAGYNFKLAGKDATVAIAYQETSEAVALGLPEMRVAAAFSVGVMENTTLSLEWAHDDDYSTADGGTGENGGNTVTGQIAVEF